MGGGGRWRATEVDVTFSQSARTAQGLADVSVLKFRLKGQPVFSKEAHSEYGELSLWPPLQIKSNKNLASWWEKVTKNEHEFC